MERELHIAAEAAAMLPASHLAQLISDADNDDNVCVACGTLIQDAVAELVVLHDDRTILARMAHSACVTSGTYAWEGTTAAVQALTLRPDGLDVATLLAWRPRPRTALALIEPRIQVSLPESTEDSLEQLFARPLGLVPVNQSIARLAPPAAAGEIRAHRHGLELVTDALRITLPAQPEVRDSWSRQAAGQAIVIIGRGLGIAGPDHTLQQTLDEALLTRPTWAATFRVTLSIPGSA